MDKPKEITPMDWKTPLLIVRRGILKLPLSDAGTRTPCVTTVIRMIAILINARVLAFANYFRQLHPLTRIKMPHLCYISIETQGVTDPQNKNNNHSPSIG
jgi:hypothetical protein